MEVLDLAKRLQGSLPSMIWETKAVYASAARTADDDDDDGELAS